MTSATRPFDLIVVGAGSGGMGAAIAAARAGLSVLVVERAATVGGTAVGGGVHNWEPGVGGTGIPFDIYRRLRRIPGAVGITTFGRHLAAPAPHGPAFPGGELLQDVAQRYCDTLCRHGAPDGRWSYAYGHAHWHSVAFEPAAYRQVVEQMLAETGCCTLRTGTSFVRATMRGDRLDSLTLSDGAVVRAPFYVDATADVTLAAACGCATTRGEESRAAYAEPSAPAAPSDRVNGVTLIYRIAPASSEAVEPLPAGIPDVCWWDRDFPVAAYTQYPCGDFGVNMLPTMDGGACLALGPSAAIAECRRRVRAHWHHRQVTFPDFRRYRLIWIAPELGVRESRRIIGEVVLTEHDLRAGLCGQAHPDVVAIADHALDTHGRGGGCRELSSPYGVPFRCLLPRGCVNLLVACRGSSFSALAASSCRLSRSLMQLGQAAGTAAALAREANGTLREVEAPALRAALQAQHVALEWPLPQTVVEHLEREDAP